MDSGGIHRLSEEELAVIVGYLNGELATDDRLQFEERLAVDARLRLQLEEVKCLLVGVREVNLLRQLDRYHADISAHCRVSTNKRWFLSRRTGWVAASVALIVCVSVWWIGFVARSNERLYRTYFIPDIGLPVQMAATDTSHYSFYDGMISYKEGAYREALTKWSQVTDGMGSTDTLQYYRGMAEMALGHIGHAIEQLSAVSIEPQSAFYEDATWYLALCYLKQDDPSNTIALLRRIPQHEQAQALLRKLD